MLFFFWRLSCVNKRWREKKLRTKLYFLEILCLYYHLRFYQNIVHKVLTRSMTLHKNEDLHQGFLQQMWPDSQFPVDLVIFTEEIHNGKLHFLCSDKTGLYQIISFSFLDWIQKSEAYSEPCQTSKMNCFVAVQCSQMFSFSH